MRATVEIAEKIIDCHGFEMSLALVEWEARWADRGCTIGSWENENRHTRTIKVNGDDIVVQDLLSILMPFARQG